MTRLALLALAAAACSSTEPAPTARPVPEVAQKKAALVDEWDWETAPVRVNGGNDYSKTSKVKVEFRTPVGKTKYCVSKTFDESGTPTECVPSTSIVASNAVQTIASFDFGAGEGWHSAAIFVADASGWTEELYIGSGSWDNRPYLFVDSKAPTVGQLVLEDQGDIGDSKADWEANSNGMEGPGKAAVPLRVQGFADGPEGSTAQGNSGLVAYKLFKGTACTGTPLDVITIPDYSVHEITDWYSNQWQWLSWETEDGQPIFRLFHDGVDWLSSVPYAACAYDKAGNASAPAKLTVKVSRDLTPPVLAAGAAMTEAWVDGGWMSDSPVDKIALAFSLPGEEYPDVSQLVTETQVGGRAVFVCFSLSAKPCAATRSGLDDGNAAGALDRWLRINGWGDSLTSRFPSGSGYPGGVALPMPAGLKEGAYTVYAYFMDDWANVATKSLSAPFIYDNTPPVDGSVIPTSGSRQSLLSLKGFRDAETSVVGYKVAVTEAMDSMWWPPFDNPSEVAAWMAQQGPPEQCNAGYGYGDNGDEQPVNPCTVNVAKGTVTCTGLTNGSLYLYRVCAIDAGGNTSKGVLTYDTPRVTLPPTDVRVAVSGVAAGVVPYFSGPERELINGLEVWGLPLKLEAKGADGAQLSAYCLTMDKATCPANEWREIPWDQNPDWDGSRAVASFTTAFSLWPLDEYGYPMDAVVPDGVRTINAWFRDEYGNTTVKPMASAKAGVDQAGPTMGTVSASFGKAAGRVDLTAKNFKDAVSGIGNYSVTAYPVPAEDTFNDVVSIYGPSVPCFYAGRSLFLDGVLPNETGESLHPNAACAIDGAKGTLGCTGLIDKQRYLFAVCAFDKAGNGSLPVYVEATPKPTTTPPSKPFARLVGGTKWARTAPETGYVAVEIGAQSVAPVTVTNYCFGYADGGGYCDVFKEAKSVQSQVVDLGPPVPDGSFSVKVWFADEYGNSTKGKPVSLAVSIDNAAPTAGTLAVTTGDGRLVATALGFADALSGLAGYRAVVGASDATLAEDCTDTSVGKVSVSGTKITVTGLTNGTTYQVRVCA
ncbi:MAG: hypothetical protein RL199_2369, partial [Pseudomonadota bacterium]